MESDLRLLLDTCTFIWYSGEPEALSAKAAEALEDAQNELLLSPISLVELCIKYAAGKIKLDAPPHELLQLAKEQPNFFLLPFEEEAALRMLALPPLHRDPFDRMLVCQALCSDLTFVTPDPLIGPYGVRTLW
jgi:PIN domain nuclease of toxin-antitoxin system